MGGSDHPVESEDTFLRMDLPYNTAWIISLWTLLQIIHVQGSNTTSSSGSSGPTYDAATKLIATVGIVIGAIIISLVVAKIADMCYDRHVLRDDASDVSDHTKELIRARLAIIQMKRRDKSKKSTLGVFRIWSAKSKRSNQPPVRINSPSKEKSVVINVGEAPMTNKNVNKYSPKSETKSPANVRTTTVSVEAKKQGPAKSQNSQKSAKSPLPPKTPTKSNKVDKGGSKKQAASTDKRVKFKEDKNMMEIQSVSTLGAQC